MHGIADPAWEDTPHVALAGFDGPLALLVDLARTRQIDLSQLPVADIIDQLMLALQAASTPLSRKGDWVVLAAWLLLLRSRLLLPVEPPPPDATEQPRDRRVARAAAQALAAWLIQRPQLGNDVFGRGQPELLGTSAATQYEVDVIELLWACAAQFEDDAPADIATVYRPSWHDLYSVLDARTHILQLLDAEPGHRPLERFLPVVSAEEPRLPLRQRSAVASTLMAGLELARDGVLRLHQLEAFAPITLSARAEPIHDQDSAAAA